MNNYLEKVKFLTNCKLFHLSFDQNTFFQLMIITYFIAKYSPLIKDGGSLTILTLDGCTAMSHRLRQTFSPLSSELGMGVGQAPANTYFRGQDGVVCVSSNSYS